MPPGRRGGAPPGRAGTTRRPAPPRRPTAYEVREPPISAIVPMTMTPTRLNLLSGIAAITPAKANVISEEIGIQHASTKAKMISAR